MRKFRSFYFAMMAIASLSFLTSCGDDDEPNPKATITFEPSAPNDAVSLAPGADVSLKVVVTSADKLKEFKAMVSYPDGLSGDTTVKDFPKAGYEFNLDDMVPEDAKVGDKVVYTFTATTNKDEVTTRTYTVNVISDVATYSAKIFGNQNEAGGSYFSSVNGQVLTSTEAKANTSVVDFLYFSDTNVTTASNSSVIAAPSNTNAQNPAHSGVATWTTAKNATEFKRLANNTSVFAAATSAAAITTAYNNATGTATSSVEQLKKDDVFAFKTVGNKYGLAKVVSIDYPSNTLFKSKITLDIKMQR